MPKPALRTIRDVELIRTGVHEISTGTWEVRPEDLVSAVEAHKAGVLETPCHPHRARRPQVRRRPRDGADRQFTHHRHGQASRRGFRRGPRRYPALLPHRYPSRSVEARTNVTDRDGREFSLVLTAVALLGATAPGIDDLHELDTVAASGRRIVLASVTYGPVNPDQRRRAVQVAAARRRRNNRITLGAC